MGKGKDTVIGEQGKDTVVGIAGVYNLSNSRDLVASLVIKFTENKEKLNFYLSTFKKIICLHFT